MRLPFRHLGSIDAFCKSSLQAHFTLWANSSHSQAGAQALDYLSHYKLLRGGAATTIAALMRIHLSCLKV